MVLRGCVSRFFLLIVVSGFSSSWINKINLRSLKKELQHLIASFVFTMHQYENRFRVRWPLVIVDSISLGEKNAMKLAYRHIFALTAGKDTEIQREKPIKHRRLGGFFQGAKRDLLNFYPCEMRRLKKHKKLEFYHFP